MCKKQNLTIIVASIMLSLFSVNFVLAANTIGGNNVGGNNVGGNNTNSPETISLDNPIASDDIPSLIGNVIKAILSIVGSLALVMFIYGGFTWMLAGGNSEKVKKGKDILTWAAIGLVVVFSSYALVKFVITQISST